jgi:molybdate transport system ATP-binding protein
MRRGTGESIWEIKSRIGTASPEIHAHTPKGLDALDVVLSGLTGAIHGSREPSPEDSNRAIARLREFVPQAIGRSFGELSFAEQRLVLVARAMVGSPELLLLDEPCQGLDAMSRALVAESVHSAAVTYGVSVIYVTHEIDELPPCITHLLELRSGRTVRSGPIRS